jgi:hypothetical protein
MSLKDDLPLKIVWKRDQLLKLEHELALLRGPTFDAKQTKEEMMARFESDLALYPYTWPVAKAAPSVQTWEFGAVKICYRMIPSAEAIQVLSITGPSDLRKRKTEPNQRVESNAVGARRNPGGSLST